LAISFIKKLAANLLLIDYLKLIRNNDAKKIDAKKTDGTGLGVAWCCWSHVFDRQPTASRGD
jgi:hypothetical protein